MFSSRAKLWEKDVYTGTPILGLNMLCWQRGKTPETSGDSPITTVSENYFLFSRIVSHGLTQIIYYLI